MKVSLFLLPLTQALPTSSPIRISSIIDAFNALVKSKNENIVYHGCHCVSFIVPQGGIPVDERDQACMAWKASRSCVTLKNGPCNDISDYAYESNGENCDGLVGCHKTLCEIDQYYSNKIQDFDTELVFISPDEIGDQCKYGYVRPSFVDIHNRQTAFENDKKMFLEQPEIRIKSALERPSVEPSVEEPVLSVDGLRSAVVEEQELLDSGFTKEEPEEDEISETAKVKDIFREWKENQKKFKKFQRHQQALRDSKMGGLFQEPAFEKVDKKEGESSLRDSCCNLGGFVWRKYSSENEKCEDGSVSPLVSYIT